LSTGTQRNASLSQDAHRSRDIVLLPLTEAFPPVTELIGEDDLAHARSMSYHLYVVSLFLWPWAAGRA